MRVLPSSNATFFRPAGTMTHFNVHYRANMVLPVIIFALGSGELPFLIPPVAVSFWQRCHALT